MRPEDCWRNLAASVIETAVDDRRNAVLALKKDPWNADAAYTLDETRRFFMSDWFETLLAASGAEADPDEVRMALNLQAEEEEY